jgi:hypothetical protein
MTRNLPRVLVALACLAAALVANPFAEVPGASAAVVWRDGVSVSSKVISCTGIILGTPWEEYGMNTWVGFSTGPGGGPVPAGAIYVVPVAGRNLNYGPGQTIPNAVLTKLAADGTVCIFTFATTHLLVDVNGALS